MESDRGRTQVRHDRGGVGPCSRGGQLGRGPGCAGVKLMFPPISWPARKGHVQLVRAGSRPDRASMVKFSVSKSGVTPV